MWLSVKCNFPRQDYNDIVSHMRVSLYCCKQISPYKDQPNIRLRRTKTKMEYVIRLKKYKKNEKEQPCRAVVYKTNVRIHSMHCEATFKHVVAFVPFYQLANINCRNLCLPLTYPLPTPYPLLSHTPPLLHTPIPTPP